MGGITHVQEKIGGQQATVDRAGSSGGQAESGQGSHGLRGQSRRRAGQRGSEAGGPTGHGWSMVVVVVVLRWRVVP
jgi:hypothetical protein